MHNFKISSRNLLDMTLHNSQFKFAILICVLLVMLFASSFAQVDYSTFSRATKGAIDTLGIETLKKLSKDKVKLMESEVEPELYKLGPGDKFTIHIMTSKSMLIETDITPDGFLVIPDAGMISLKNLTLAEGRDSIRNLIRKSYKTDNIGITLSDIKEFKVSVSGEALRSTVVNATGMERVSEVIDKTGGISKDASMRNIRIQRKNSHKLITVDLIRYYLLADKNANPYLQGGDNIIVSPAHTEGTIEIEGDVLSPNEFEFMPGDSLSHLVKFAHGFTSSSLLDSIEFIRVDRSSGRVIKSYLNLKKWKKLDDIDKNKDLDFELYSGDRLYVRTDRNWKKKKYVVLEGAVVYPGEYYIDEGLDRVSELLERAGGFRDNADLNSIEFIRQADVVAFDPEMERLKSLNPNDMSESEARYFQARIREKKGAMAVDFNKIMESNDSEDNILLKSQDSIIVSEVKYYINIQGRVNNPGSVPFKEGYTYLDYIEQAGGFGFRADISEALVTKSKGEQYLAEETKKYVLSPGDVILVPPQKELTAFEIFTSTLTILTQLVTIAGVVIAIANLNRR